MPASQYSQPKHTPSNPAFSNILIGYHTMGIFPTGRMALGILAVRSVIRDPLPPAITTGWNSILILSESERKKKTGTFYVTVSGQGRNLLYSHGHTQNGRSTKYVMYCM
jgi:hypothetical protein